MIRVVKWKELFTRTEVEEIVVGILTDIQLEIEDRRTDYDKDSKAEHDIYCAYDKCSRIIQQKISSLKEYTDDNN